MEQEVLIQAEKLDQKNNDCVFCKIVSGEINSEKIDESENFIAIKDQNPEVENHSLIISKKHYVNFLDLPSTLGGELMNFIKKITLTLIKETNASGFNLVQNNFPSAGQIVMHSHIHLLPRKEDDGKQLKIVDKNKLF